MKGGEVDVAIVGGGPAGLTAATCAVRGGLTVKVFEEKQEIGLPVKCGELLPTIREMRTLLPEAEGIRDLFSVPDSAIANRCRAMRVFSPRGKAWEFDFEVNVLHRHIFEKLLAEKAVHSGVELTLETHAKLFSRDDGKYVGRSREEAIKATVVIAADGFPSETCLASPLPAKRYMTPYSVAAVVQHQMAGVRVEEDVAEMYFDPGYAPGGFAWVIPKGDRVANVGMGIRTPFMRGKGNVRNLLDTFIAHHPIAKDKLSEGTRVGTVSDLLPIDGPIGKTVDDSIIAVGDAAGMVIPTTGAGIPTALVTGKLAGKAAADYLNDGSPLSSYETLWREQIGGALRRATRLRRVADSFVGNGPVIHGVLSVLGVRGIRDVLTCRTPLGVGLILTLLQVGWREGESGPSKNGRST